jgi:hypothetical protein
MKFVKHILAGAVAAFCIGFLYQFIRSLDHLSESNSEVIMFVAQLNAMNAIFVAVASCVSYPILYVGASNLINRPVAISICCVTLAFILTVLTVFTPLADFIGRLFPMGHFGFAAFFIMMFIMMLISAILIRICLPLIIKNKA